MSHGIYPGRNALAKMAWGQVWKCNGIPTQMQAPPAHRADLSHL